jgi:alpha-amylase/alpha-mannosidase (GH57 family)
MGAKLNLVLLWHMHQPDYRDYATGEFRLPWTYLHAIKDYADMAWHLEHHAGVKAVVNFSPVLLDQLEDYAEQFSRGKVRDPLLRLLAREENAPIGESDRTLILERCFRANRERMIQPFPAYKHLHELFSLLDPLGQDSFHHLSDQYFYDLITWYHLAWTGETVRRGSETVARLMAVGAHFSRSHRLELLKLIGEVVSGVVARYAKLAASGRIELSTTPQHHPLAPLLISFASALEADPGVALPLSPQYPGGYGRVEDQLVTAQRDHARRFGKAPAGVWPAEGAVSDAFLGLLAKHGCRWAASGTRVLLNSLRRTEEQTTDPASVLYRPYGLHGAPDLTLFFRDDRLSDLIGFEYAKWNSRDAAANLVSELETIAAGTREGETRTVSVILDGENCWEYYPYNGFYFLEALYQSLESHPVIRTMTYRDVLAQAGRPVQTLDHLTAGSWVQGDFATWIGSPEKNHAWDLLCEAKQSFDLVMASGRLDEARRGEGLRQLGACEASDWFWWLGDYNSQFAVASFDELYRDALGNLYRLLGLPPPEGLARPLGRGAGHPEAGGAMRRAAEPSSSG